MAPLTAPEDDQEIMAELLQAYLRGAQPSRWSASDKAIVLPMAQETAKVKENAAATPPTAPTAPTAPPPPPPHPFHTHRTHLNLPIHLTPSTSPTIPTPANNH